MFHCGLPDHCSHLETFSNHLMCCRETFLMLHHVKWVGLKAGRVRTGTLENTLQGKGGASTQVTTNVQAGNHKKTALWIVLLTTPDLRKHKTSHEHEIDFLLATSLQYRYSSLNTEKPNWVGRICLLHWLKKWLHGPDDRSRVLNCNKTGFQRKHNFMNSIYTNPPNAGLE